MNSMHGIAADVGEQVVPRSTASRAPACRRTVRRTTAPACAARRRSSARRPVVLSYGTAVGHLDTNGRGRGVRWATVVGLSRHRAGAGDDTSSSACHIPDQGHGLCLPPGPKDPTMAQMARRERTLTASCPTDPPCTLR